jgi:uncharacterized protein YodC (DUF2158 family)
MSASERLPQPQIGEIVYLRSGGPAMTSINVDPENGLILCRWFWRGKCHFQSFTRTELVAWCGDSAPPDYLTARDGYVVRRDSAHSADSLQE